MFRFTIRDVLWAFVVFAVACGWFAFAVRKNHEAAERQREHRDQLFSLKSRIFAYQTAINSYYRLQDHQRSGLMEDAQKLTEQILSERNTSERERTEAFLREHVGK